MSRLPTSRPFTLLSLALAAALALPAAAQDVGAVDLGGVVVTAAGFSQVIEDAPASISVITREELATRPFHDLTDALGQVEGVSVTGPAGERDIFIRGMPGAYTLILVDGKRQSTRDARTNGNAGFEQSFIPPLEAIDRIEVVRGPMSSLYGSDAMGGVINIITRKVPKAWGGSLGADVTVQQHADAGTTRQGQFYLGGPLVGDKLGLQLWGRRLARGEDDYLNGFPQDREDNLSARLALRPDVRQDLTLEAGREHVTRANRGGRTLAATAADTENRNPRSRASVAYEGRWGWGQSNVSLATETARRENFTRAASGALERNPRAPEVRNRVFDTQFALPVASHNLVLGGQASQRRLIDQNPGRRDGTAARFTIREHALFVEDEWRLADAFALTGGARLDHHRIYGDHWSPRLYGVWHAGARLTVKGGVSRGFRAPEIRQIAPGYAYTTGGANCSYGPTGTCAVIVGDPGLKPETSTSTELAVLWDNHQGFDAHLTLFHTDFRDKVTDVQPLDANGDYLRWSEDPNYRVYYWSNVDRARIKGAELGSRWAPREDLNLVASWTRTLSRQMSGAYKGYALARTPDQLAQLRAEWVPAANWKLWLGGNWHGREINAQLRTGSAGKPIPTPNGRVVREYGGYASADLGGSWQLGRQTTLNAAVYNLGDRQLDYDDYATVIDGRRLWLGLTVRL